MSRTVIEDRCQRLNVRQLRPLGDYIFIKEIERNRSAEGLFIVAQSPNAELCIGEVMAVGRGILNTEDGSLFPLEINVGDIILSIQYMGERLKIAGEKYRMLHEHGVWAILRLADTDSMRILEVRPRFACILVEPDAEETAADGRLILPDRLNMKERLATIISTGPGLWHMPSKMRIPTGYEPGQRVLMNRCAGAEVPLNGKTLRLIQQNDIICVVEKTV